MAKENAKQYLKVDIVENFMIKRYYRLLLPMNKYIPKKIFLLNKG